MKRRQHNMQIYCIVATVAVIIYLNTLSGDFVHDDLPAIVMNRDVLGTNSLLDLLKNDFWGMPMSEKLSHKSYRPLTTLTFRINRLLFGINSSFSFKFVNVLLHSVSSVLFTRICTNIVGFKIKFALIAGILFAIHPIHTEAVCGIVGRAEILACMFFSLSLLFYHGHDTTVPDVWWSILLGGLSMLAKESGITVFIVNLAYDIYKNWMPLKKAITDVRWNEETYQFVKRTSCLIFSMIILLAARIALLQGSLPRFSQQDNPPAFHSNFYVRLLTFLYLSAFNCWLLLCPTTLSHDWQMNSIPLIMSVKDTRNLLTIITFCVIILVIYKIFIDLELQRHVPIVLGFILLVFPFLPATNLLVTVGFVLAERILYIPSMGFLILVLYGVQTLYEYENVRKLRRILQLSGILLICFCCIKTIMRNRDWQTRESLLISGLKVLPNNAKMHYNYANFLRDISNTKRAKLHYQKALKLWPNYASAYNNLGTLIEDIDVAEEHFLAAIHFSAEHINAHYNLGQLYRRTNQTQKSIEMFEKCIQFDRMFVPAYVGLSKMHRGFLSGILLRRAVSFNDENGIVRLEYAEWLYNHNLLNEALKQYFIGFNYKSNIDQLWLQTGAAKILRKSGQKQRLHQLILRWHIMQRNEGAVSISNIYLRDWHMKHEIERRALIYDTIHRMNDTSNNNNNNNNNNNSNNNNNHNNHNSNSNIRLPTTLQSTPLIKIPHCNRSGSVYISTNGHYCDNLIPNASDDPLIALKASSKRNTKKWSKIRYKYREIFNIVEENGFKPMIAIDKL